MRVCAVAQLDGHLRDGPVGAAVAAQLGQPRSPLHHRVLQLLGPHYQPVHQPLRAFQAIEHTLLGVVRVLVHPGRTHLQVAV